MDGITDFLRDHDGSIAIAANLTFAGVVAWAAWAATRLSRDMRDATVDPSVVVFLELRSRSGRLFDLVVRNVGAGSARNISFQLEGRNPESTRIEIGIGTEIDIREISLFRNGIRFMAPQQEIRTFIGTMSALEEKQITVHVKFDRDNRSGKSDPITASFYLDVNEFKDLWSSSPTDQAKVAAEALKKIAQIAQRIEHHIAPAREDLYRDEDIDMGQVREILADLANSSPADGSPQPRGTGTAI